MSRAVIRKLSKEIEQLHERLAPVEESTLDIVFHDIEGRQWNMDGTPHVHNPRAIYLGWPDPSLSGSAKQ